MCTFLISWQRTHDFKEGWRTLSRSNQNDCSQEEAFQAPTKAFWKSLPWKLNPPLHFQLLPWPFNHHMMTVWDNSAQIHTDPTVHPHRSHGAEAKLSAGSRGRPAAFDQNTLAWVADNKRVQMTHHLKFHILTAKVVVAKCFSPRPLDVCCLIYSTDSSALIDRLLQCANNFFQC